TLTHYTTLHTALRTARAKSAELESAQARRDSRSTAPRGGRATDQSPNAWYASTAACRSSRAAPRSPRPPDCADRTALRAELISSIAAPRSASLASPVSDPDGRGEAAPDCEPVL